VDDTKMYSRSRPKDDRMPRSQYAKLFFWSWITRKHALPVFEETSGRSLLVNLWASRLKTAASHHVHQQLCLGFRSGYSKRVYNKSNANKTLLERKRKLTGYHTRPFLDTRTPSSPKKNSGTPSLMGHKVSKPSSFLHRGQATEY
jgi:hypothetical protein